VAFGGSVKVDRAFLDALLRLPSENGNAAELARAVNFTYDWLTARGLHCTIETNDAGRLGLYASVKPGKKQDYFFVSHLDVIKAPPQIFEPRYEGDKVFARGACDTKGNVAAVCSALVALAGSNASVSLFLATDEEGGGSGIGTPQMMIDRGYSANKMILVGDSAGEEPGQLFTAEKGHAHIDLIAHGKGGHSSRPWALDNPIPRLCEAYLKFKAAWDPNADPNEHWRTVVSPTVLEASQVNNVVADSARMHFSCRYISMSDYERVLKTFKEVTRDIKGVKLKARPGRRPVENKPGDPEIASLLKAMNDSIPGGMREGRMSAATDASYYAQLDVPIVIFAADGGEPHSDREWGSLASLDAYADFFARYFSK
jgi:succinyl-diaminopimelate desuccinylase